MDLIKLGNDKYSIRATSYALMLALQESIEESNISKGSTTNIYNQFMLLQSDIHDYQEKTNNFNGFENELLYIQSIYDKLFNLPILINDISYESGTDHTDINQSNFYDGQIKYFLSEIEAKIKFLEKIPEPQVTFHPSVNPYVKDVGDLEEGDIEVATKVSDANENFVKYNSLLKMYNKILNQQWDAGENLDPKLRENITYLEGLGQITKENIQEILNKN